MYVSQCHNTLPLFLYNIAKLANFTETFKEKFLMLQIIIFAIIPYFLFANSNPFNTDSTTCSKVRPFLICTTGEKRT